MTSSSSKSVLDNLPSNLTTLEQAQKLQDLAAGDGFEWNEISDLFNKIREEINELQEAIDEADPAHIEEEAGDLLFVMVNLLRMKGISAENALQKGNQKFERRFKGMESDLAERGLRCSNLTLPEMIKFWVAQKKKETAQLANQPQP